MRILFLTNFYPPHELGGYAQWCQEVAVKLQDKGHDVLVLTSRHMRDSSNTIIEKGIVRKLYLQAEIDYYQPVDFFLKRSRQEKSNIDELAKCIENFKPDTIMVWGMWNLSSLVPHHAEKLLPGKVAYYIASYWPIDTNLHTAYWQAPANRKITEFIKIPFRHAALAQILKEALSSELEHRYVYCCSEFVRDTLVAAGSIPSSAEVLLGGIDPTPFLIKQQENHKEISMTLKLVYFGRLIYDKGVHTAIEALGNLRRKGINHRIELTIIGGGHPEYMEYLKDLGRKLRVSDRIKYTDQVPRDQVPRLLKRFDAYLFTSIWPEPMARSVMEAMAAGLLVIGTEVGGQVEMLRNEQNALTFQAEDPLGLANQIERAMNDSALRKQLALSGKEMVIEHFTIDRMVDEIEKKLLEISS